MDPDSPAILPDVPPIQPDRSLVAYKASDTYLLHSSWLESSTDPCLNVYCRLVDLARNEEGVFFLPPLEQLGPLCGMSKATIARHLRELHARGMIEVMNYDRGGLRTRLQVLVHVVRVEQVVTLQKVLLQQQEAPMRGSKHPFTRNVSKVQTSGQKGDVPNDTLHNIYHGTSAPSTAENPPESFTFPPDIQKLIRSLRIKNAAGTYCTFEGIEDVWLFAWSGRADFDQIRTAFRKLAKTKLVKSTLVGLYRNMWEIDPHTGHGSLKAEFRPTNTHTSPPPQAHSNAPQPRRAPIYRRDGTLPRHVVDEQHRTLQAFFDGKTVSAGDLYPHDLLYLEHQHAIARDPESPQRITYKPSSIDWDFYEQELGVLLTPQRLQSQALALAPKS